MRNSWKQVTRRTVSLLLSLVLFFAGNGQLLITDPVESNYALTAKEMLASGDWLSPRIYGNYWYDKPWMFYGDRKSTRLNSSHMSEYRMPSSA